MNTVNAIVNALGGWSAVFTGIVTIWTAFQEVRHQADAKKKAASGSDA